MNPATSGAADPRQPDNSIVKQQQQQRAPSPARFKDATPKTPSKGGSAKAGSGKQGGKSSRSSSPVAAGKDRQASKGAAAVHPSGAESPTAKRSDKTRRIDERHSSTEDADEPPLKSDRVVSDQPSSSKSSQSKAKSTKIKDGGVGVGKQSSNNNSSVGCGAGFWREGCLQSELIQFHMNKSLKKEGGMHAKKANSSVTGLDISPESASRPTESQVESQLRDEIEMLTDENDNLKVNPTKHVISWAK